MIKFLDLQKVNAQYEEELMASHDDYKKRLFEQLVQAEDLKLEKAQQAARDKTLAKLKKEADETFTPLSFTK